jgi:hypothetical protein
VEKKGTAKSEEEKSKKDDEKETKSKNYYLAEAPRQPGKTTLEVEIQE